MGVYPQMVFHYMTPSVNQTVDNLTAWAQRNAANLPQVAAFDPTAPAPVAPSLVQAEIQ